MTRPIPEKALVTETRKAVASLLDVPLKDVAIRAGKPDESDLVVSAGGYTFVVELVQSATAGPIAAHARRAADAAKKVRKKNVVPAVVVHFMSDGGRRACEEAGVSWFDLSGNAHVTAPQLRVIVDGRPNRFREPGRPSSVFAPKSARVVRLLLQHPERAFTQRELAHETQMGEGFVSRIVRRLEAESYLERVALDGAGRAGKAPVRVRDPALLLNAWRDEYQFEKHKIIRGHVAVRSSENLVRIVGDTLAAAQLEHAATGLAAAWQLTHFATFRIATFFVADVLPTDVLEKIGFRDDARGANLWLVVPNDEGVFQGAGQSQESVRCVHPVQAYLDLKGHPERAPEAAERLRSEFMNWKKRDG